MFSRTFSVGPFTPFVVADISTIAVLAAGSTPSRFVDAGRLTPCIGEDSVVEPPFIFLKSTWLLGTSSRPLSVIWMSFSGLQPPPTPLTRWFSRGFFSRSVASIPLPERTSSFGIMPSKTEPFSSFTTGLIGVMGVEG